MGKDDDAIRAILGFLPQKFDLYPNLTGTELLDYVAYAKGIKSKDTRRKEVERWLQKVNMLEQGRKRIKTYSGGMKQHCGLVVGYWFPLHGTKVEKLHDDHSQRTGKRVEE